jgi:hypothetical protein
MLFGFLKDRMSRRQPDIELGQQTPFINGYPSAAAFIASDPDHAFSIYNSFHRLSSGNLLYLEAELFELQKRQDDMDVRDSRGDPDTLQCFRSWKKLSTSSDTYQVERLDLIMKIRTKLKEYRKLAQVLPGRRFQIDSANDTIWAYTSMMQKKLSHSRRQFSRWGNHNLKLSKL